MIFDRVSKPVADAVYEVIREKLDSGVPLCSPVTSKSMSPLIKPGDRIKIHAAKIDSLKKGTIVALRAGDEIVAHRFIGKVDQDSAVMLLTKSDVALIRDMPVPAICFVGVVTERERNNRWLKLSSWEGWLVSLLCRGRAAIGVIDAVAKRYVQEFVLRTNHVAGISSLYRGYYLAVIWLLKVFLSRTKGVEAIWLRRSFALGDWEAGRSDLDLGIKIETTGLAEDAERTALVAKRYRGLKKLTLVCGELEVYTGSGLALDCRYTGRGREALSWKLVSGFAPELNAYAANPVNYKLDAIEEILISFIALGRVLIKENRQNSLRLHPRRRTTKLFIDILKWITAIEHNLGGGCSVPMNTTALKGCLEGLPQAHFLNRIFAGLQDGVLPGLPQVFMLYAEVLNYLASCTAVLSSELNIMGITNVVVPGSPRHKTVLPSFVCEVVSEIYPQLEFYVFPSPLAAQQVAECITEGAKTSSIPILCTEDLLSLYTLYLPENAVFYYLQHNGQDELAKLLVGQQIAALLRSASRIAATGKGRWAGNITERKLLSVTVDSLVLILALDRKIITHDREELLRTSCRVYPEMAEEISALSSRFTTAGGNRTEASKVTRIRWLEHVYPFIVETLTS